MSQNHFYNLLVKDIKKESDDCVSIAFHLDDSIKANFNFKAGQYITIKWHHENEEIRRSYSLCSAPHEHEFRVAVKKVSQGLFSTFANETLKIGQQLEVMPPMGNFIFEPNATNVKKYLAFAAGSGITPIISIIKTVLHNEANSHFTLVYGNQSVASIIFKESLEALKNKYPQRFQLIHVLSREKLESEINYGRIDRVKCEQLFSYLIPIKNMDQVFLCGPEQMILSLRDLLYENGLEKNQVKFELFTTDGSGAKANKKNVEHIDTVALCDVTIKVDDRTFDLKLAYGGTSILDAALSKGADLPFACKGGVCCTCRAKLIEGEVDMDVNYSLEDDEVAQGFILTCQAHPKSKKVVVDFDVS